MRTPHPSPPPSSSAKRFKVRCRLDGRVAAIQSTFDVTRFVWKFKSNSFHMKPSDFMWKGKCCHMKWNCVNSVKNRISQFAARRAPGHFGFVPGRYPTSTGGSCEIFNGSLWVFSLVRSSAHKLSVRNYISCSFERSWVVQPCSFERSRAVRMDWSIVFIRTFMNYSSEHSRAVQICSFERSWALFVRTNFCSPRCSWTLFTRTDLRCSRTVLIIHRWTVFIRTFMNTFMNMFTSVRTNVHERFTNVFVCSFCTSIW